MSRLMTQEEVEEVLDSVLKRVERSLEHLERCPTVVEFQEALGKAMVAEGIETPTIEDIRGWIDRGEL